MTNVFTCKIFKSNIFSDEKRVLVRLKSSNAFVILIQTKSVDAITLIKYLAISSWTLSTWNLLLNIYKITGRIIMKL